MITITRDSDANGSLDQRLWVVQDTNWNVTALLNDSGIVVERYAYDAYGAVTILDAAWAVKSDGSDTAIRPLWQGLRLDDVSGLYHARNREVSATLGRPLQRDPIGFAAGDVNVYRWVGNGPIGAVDPFGLWKEIPRDQWPHWVKSLPGKPDATGGRGVVDSVIRVIDDMNHPGIGHFDVVYKDTDGFQARQRFHRSGIPFTEAEHQLLTHLGQTSKGAKRGGKPKGGGNRQGSINSRALAAIGIMTVIIGGVHYTNQVMVDAGERGCERGVTYIVLGNVLRWEMLQGNLPSDRPFSFVLRDETYKVWVEKSPNSDGSTLVVIKLTPGGVEQVIRPGEIPVIR